MTQAVFLPSSRKVLLCAPMPFYCMGSQCFFLSLPGFVSHHTSCSVGAIADSPLPVPVRPKASRLIAITSQSLQSSPKSNSVIS